MRIRFTPLRRTQHSTIVVNNAERRRLARCAWLRELVRIASRLLPDAEAITAHSEPPVIVAFWHGRSPCSTSIPTSSCPTNRRTAPSLPLASTHPRHHGFRPAPDPTPRSTRPLHIPAVTVRPHRPRGGRSPAMNRYDGDIMGATLEDTIIDCAPAL